MENDIDINELERLAKAATPGPWKLVGTVEQDGGTYRDIIPTSVSCGGWCQGGTPDRADECDLQYISAANPFSVLSLIDSLRKAKMRVQILERNLRDAEESGRRLAKQAHRAEQERDALAARLAELEGQEPVAWVYDWQAPEGLIKGWVETNRDAIPEHATNIRPLYARPAPAEPVNARLLDVAVWPAGYCRDPNGKMSIPAGKEEDFNFGYDVGFQEAWEILNSAISAAGKSPTSQQERLLQDMQAAITAAEAQRQTDYSSTVDRAWARFCGAFGDGPDAPYPGMIAAFETHYGQSFRDKEWRTEAACWAAAWSKATARAEASLAEPQPDADGPWKTAVIDQLVIAHILTAEHESDPLKAIQDLLAYHADIAVDPRVSGAAAKLVEQAKAEEREACLRCYSPDDTATDWADRIKARGQK